MSKCKVNHFPYHLFQNCENNDENSQIDVTYYPFDTQMCELKFASWTTEVTRVSSLHLKRFTPALIDGPQINMTIGDISEKEILSLYSPSGRSFN